MLVYVIIYVIEREIFSLNMDLITVPWIFIIIMLYQYNIIVVITTVMTIKIVILKNFTDRCIINGTKFFSLSVNLLSRYYFK